MEVINLTLPITLIGNEEHYTLITAMDENNHIQKKEYGVPIQGHIEEKVGIKSKYHVIFYDSQEEALEAAKSDNIEFCTVNKIEKILKGKDEAYSIAFKTPFDGFFVNDYVLTTADEKLANKLYYGQTLIGFGGII